MKITRLTISALLATLAIAPAQAAHFVFSYAAYADYIQPGSPVSATLFLTTSDRLNTAGGYDILSATGTIDGNAVLGLVGNPDQPDPYFDGIFGYNNVLYTGGGAALDPDGFAVTTASGEYNFGYGLDLNGDPVDRYFSWIHTGPSNPGYSSSAGTASLVEAPVPEPASWVMMIMGFGLAGGAMRRRQATVSFA